MQRVKLRKKTKETTQELWYEKGYSKGYSEGSSREKQKSDERMQSCERIVKVMEIKEEITKTSMNNTLLQQEKMNDLIETIKDTLKEYGNTTGGYEEVEDMVDCLVQIQYAIETYCS